MANDILQTVFDFTDADLVANRAGRLSDRQRAMIAPYLRPAARRSSPLAVILVIFALLSAAAWLYAAFIVPLDGTARLVYNLGGGGFFFFFLLLVLWTTMGRNRAASAGAKDDEAELELQRVQGTAEAGFGREYLPGTETLRDSQRLVIGGKGLAPFWSVGWHERLPEAFEPGRTYTAYYITLRHPAGYNEDLVMSVEVG